MCIFVFHFLLSIFILILILFPHFAFAGFGIAGFLVINSTIIAEISPRSYRACCQATLFTGWGVGSVVIVIIGALVIPLFGWRVFLLAAVIPVLIGSLGLFIVDESPRYLVMSGEKDAAFKLLKKMADECKKELPSKELEGVVIESNEKASISAIFKKQFCSAVSLTGFMSFIAGFTYYGAVFLSAQLPVVQYKCLEGHSDWPKPTFEDDSCCLTIPKDTYISIGISAVGDLFAGYFMTFSVDRFGRKKSMISCLIISSILFMAPIFCLPRRLQDINLMFLRCFILTFCQSSFVYMIEIFPTTIRSTAVGVCSLSKRIGGMLTPFVGQVNIEHTFLFKFLDLILIATLNVGQNFINLCGLAEDNCSANVLMCCAQRMCSGEL